MQPDEFAEYVDHPRFGRRPRHTGLNPDPFAPEVLLHWYSTTRREIAERYEAITGLTWQFGPKSPDASAIKRIPETAVVADLARQSTATVPVTHYFDLKCFCRDCKRPFIFFAEEQRYWYEELGFGLDSLCVRCVPCRKRRQVVARKRFRYEELCHVPTRSTDENLEMAECCLSLIELSAFTSKQLQRVRALLNRLPRDAESIKARYNDLAARVRSIEGEQGGCTEATVARGFETEVHSPPPGELESTDH